MAFVPTPPTRKITALWSLGFDFEKIATKFANTAIAIENVLFIGAYLALPFAVMSGLFTLCQSTVWQADLQIGLALSWIDKILDGWLIVDLIEGLWGEMRYIRNNPVNWITDKMVGLWSEFNQVRYNPLDWFRQKLNLLFPTLWILFDNTRQWFLSIIQQYWPFMYQLFLNPFGTLREWIYSLWPVFRDFINNPTTFIFNRLIQRYPVFYSLLTDTLTTIINMLFNRYPDFRELLLNPLLWFRNRLANMLNIPFTSPNSFIDIIITRLISAITLNRWNIRERIRTGLCDIIVSFL